MKWDYDDKMLIHRFVWPKNINVSHGHYKNKRHPALYYSCLMNYWDQPACVNHITLAYQLHWSHSETAINRQHWLYSLPWWGCEGRSNLGQSINLLHCIALHDLSRRLLGVAPDSCASLGSDVHLDVWWPRCLGVFLPRPRGACYPRFR